MNIFTDLLDLFYPKLCVVCETHLARVEPALCVNCRHDLPFTEITNLKDNKVMHSFYGKLDIEEAFAFFWFHKENSVQKMIHALKYQSNEAVGEILGDWIGQFVKAQQWFTNVDCIIPVPLHPKRERERGYNQVSKFGRKISEHLEVHFHENLLQRVSSTKTQTFKSRLDRFSNVGTKFQINPKIEMPYKHILIVDDVITTGATIEACAKEILSHSTCKISVLSMAYTA